MKKAVRSPFFYGTLIFLICWIAYFSSYIGRLNFSAVLPTLTADTGFSKSALGLVGTAFFLSYGLGQLVVCTFADRVSPRVLITIGLIGSAVCNLFMALAQSPGMMVCFWFLNGAVQSLTWSPLLRLITTWLPQEQRAKAAVNINSTSPAGSIASYGISSLLLASVSWRYVFVTSAVFLLITGLVSFFGLRWAKRRLEETALPPEASEPAQQAEKAVKSVPFWKLLLTSGILLMMFSIMFNGILKEGVVMWIPTFITEKYQLSPSIALVITTLLPIFNLSGIYVASFLRSRYLHDELQTSAVLFGVSTLALGTLALFPGCGPIVSMVLLAITTACMLGVNGMILIFVPMCFSAVGRCAAITGFLNAFAYGATALSTYVFGTIAQNFGWDATVYSWVAVALLGAFFAWLASIPWKRYKAGLPERP